VHDCAQSLPQQALEKGLTFVSAITEGIGSDGLTHDDSL
jgi:hypothetical protein